MNRFSEKWAILATVDPADAATGTSTSDVIDMSLWDHVAFIVAVGGVAGTGLVDFKVEEGTSTTSFNTSTALVSMTQLGDADDNKQVVVEVEAEKLTDTYRYIRGILTLGTAAGAATVVALGGHGRYKPAYLYDLASVDEIANA